MKKKIVIGVTFVLALLMAGVGGAAANNYITGAVPGSQVQVSGCVIRFSNSDGTPSLHANAAHRCAGVSSVRVDPASGWLEVQQTVRGAAQNPVLFAQAQTDETLAGRGIMVGATGGTDSTRFAMYDTRINRPLDLRNRSDRMRVQGRNSNLWIGFFHTKW